jgi:hypothetical protein
MNNERSLRRSPAMNNLNENEHNNIPLESNVDTLGSPDFSGISDFIRTHSRRNALDNFDQGLAHPDDAEPYPEPPALPHENENEYYTDSEEFNSSESSEYPYWNEPLRKSSKEEDNNLFSEITSSSDSLNVNSEKFVDKCLNISPLTLEPYTEDPDLFIVYIQDKNGKFTNGTCSTKEELKSSLKSDRMKPKSTNTPTNIMSIYSTPNSNRKDDYITGMTGKPTAKLVIRLISNNIYVTYGSVKDIFSSKNKEWFAIPLFGGLRRRIGNVMGIYGASMNHGQAPGYPVYKLLTRKQVENNEVVKESVNDYYYGFDSRPLNIILEEKMIPINIFVNSVIQNITTSRIKKANVESNLFRRLINPRIRTPNTNQTESAPELPELPEWNFN